ncbi:hypothetical protein PVAP13_4KG165310 [Panicum virgatum]|uniref:Uncharacterized protein n=1 Tax=Panicum virgatum TaxID=38727 RepID=A0A8T0TSX0_PANVG|nr:hypothetical protein PVAP13_4KG165310 [Panicum virgatum]
MSMLERVMLFEPPSLARQVFALHTAEQQARMPSNAYHCRILLILVFSLLVISSSLAGALRPPNCQQADSNSPCPGFCDPNLTVCHH